MQAFRRVVLAGSVLAAGLIAQEPVGAPLRLVEPGSLPARPAERNAKPPGPVEHTYQRRKVDAISHDREGLAIQGYDAVAYLDRRPQRGRREYSVEHAGAIWLFDTADNRDSFRREPERYIPQYGGFCAFSIGIGSPAHADPRVFAVVDGKVYLFFDTAVRLVWEQEREHSLQEANARWPELHR